MKYAIELTSGGMIYIPSFMTIGSGFQKYLWGGIPTHRQQGDLISLLLFLHKKRSGLENGMYLDWIHLARDKNLSRALVHMAKNFRLSTKRQDIFGLLSVYRHFKEGPAAVSCECA
jgi:hypothetical protein